MDALSLKKNYADGQVWDEEIFNADQTAVEAAINKITQSETDGDSGADHIAITPIAGLESIKKLQPLLEAIYSAIVTAVLGQIPNASLGAEKLSFDVATQAELDALAGTGNSHTVKEAYDLASGAQVITLLTTIGDMLGRDANGLIRIPKGLAHQILGMNADATAQEYKASLQSLMTAAGDMIIASGANSPVRLALTANALLKSNGTVPTWLAADGTANKAVISNGSDIVFGYPVSARFVPSDTVIMTANTERAVNGTGTVKSFTPERAGTFRIKGQFKTSGANPCSIYIKNSANQSLGMAQTSSQSYVPFSIDTSLLNLGDVLWLEIQCANTGYVRLVTCCASVQAYQNSVID